MPDRELTATQIEQIDRLLKPGVRDAVREELDCMVEKLTAHMSTLVEPINTKITDHDTRLKKVEGNQGRAMIGWAAIVFVVTTLASGIFGWLKKKIGLS